MSVQPKARPTLETERLLLRPFRISDAPDVTCLAGAREIASNTLSIPHPYEQEHAESWLCSHQEAWEQGIRAQFAVALRKDSTLVGAVGLGICQERARAELGYWIGVPYWNRGYCTEAARAVVAFSFEELGLNRIDAHHLLRNPALGRVMQKLGMTREGTLRHYILKWGQFEDVVVYGLLREEHTARLRLS